MNEIHDLILNATLLNLHNPFSALSQSVNGQNE